MRRVTQQLERAGITRANGPGVPTAKRTDRVSQVGTALDASAKAEQPVMDGGDARQPRGKGGGRLEDRVRARAIASSSERASASSRRQEKDIFVTPRDPRSTVVADEFAQMIRGLSYITRRNTLNAAVWSRPPGSVTSREKVASASRISS